MIDTETIKNNIDLHALIAHDNEITGKDRTWCPFCQFGGSAQHNSPAFQIYENKSFNCFGCGAAGDAISYIMHRDDLDFIEACKVLGWDGESIAQSDLSEIRAENQRRQDEIKSQRNKEIDRKLSQYSTEEIWQAYQRRMEVDQVKWWETQGIPADWQSYLRLGYTDNKIYKDKTGLHHSPAYTIPYFHQGFDFRNMQYRLCADGIKERYRFESDLRTTYYMVTPSEPIEDQVVICEGAKKGIVSHLYSKFGKTTFLAVPSKTDFGGVVEAVKDCGVVYIILDPDAWIKPANAGSNWIPSPIKLARMIGKAAKIVDLPGKIDDLFLEGSLNRTDLMWLMMSGKQVVK